MVKVKLNNSLTNAEEISLSEMSRMLKDIHTALFGKDRKKQTEDTQVSKSQIFKASLLLKTAKLN